MSETSRPEPATAVTTAPTVDPFWGQVDRLFRELHQSFEPAAVWNGRLPAVTDVVDLGESFEIRAELPGVPKEKVDIRVTGDTVQISADLTREATETGPNYLRHERTGYGFERQVVLPEPVREDGITAKSENGVLTVLLPKAHPVVERKVPVA